MLKSRTMAGSDAKARRQTTRAIPAASAVSSEGRWNVATAITASTMVAVIWKSGVFRTSHAAQL